MFSDISNSTMAKSDAMQLPLSGRIRHCGLDPQSPDCRRLSQNVFCTQMTQIQGIHADLYVADNMRIIGQFFICANLQYLRHLRAFKTASAERHKFRNLRQSGACGVFIIPRNS